MAQVIILKSGLLRLSDYEILMCSEIWDQTASPQNLKHNGRKWMGNYLLTGRGVPHGNRPCSEVYNHPVPLFDAGSVTLDRYQTVVDCIAIKGAGEARCEHGF